MALLDGLVKLSCQVQLQRQVMADRGGSRIEIQCSFRHCQGLLCHPARAEIKRIEVVRPAN
jgi:hypothetical protein